MVSFQKATRLFVVSADDADSTGATQSESISEGKGGLGEFDLLDWDLHWPQSFMQSLFDHLISSLV